MERPSTPELIRSRPVSPPDRYADYNPETTPVSPASTTFPTPASTRPTTPVSYRTGLNAITSSSSYDESSDNLSDSDYFTVVNQNSSTANSDFFSANNNNTESSDDDEYTWGQQAQDIASGAFSGVRDAGSDILSAGMGVARPLGNVGLDVARTIVNNRPSIETAGALGLTAGVYANAPALAGAVALAGTGYFHFSFFAS